MTLNPKGCLCWLHITKVFCRTSLLFPAVGGRLAVGGNALLGSFTVGSGYPPAPDPPPRTPPSVRSDVIVAGALCWASGAVLSGGNVVRYTLLHTLLLPCLLHAAPCPCFNRCTAPWAMRQIA